jgi:hypothetical protein
MDDGLVQEDDKDEGQSKTGNHEHDVNKTTKKN